jgi:hypothetical protein
MKVKKNIPLISEFRGFVSALAVVACAWPIDSYAYLDPGTGSLMLQAIVAGIFAGLFAVKRYIFMIIGFLKSPFKKRDSKSADSTPDDRVS